MVILIYFLVKDLYLSGLQPGVLVWKVVSCEPHESNDVRHKLIKAKYQISLTTFEPIKDMYACDWKRFPRLE